MQWFWHARAALASFDLKWDVPSAGPPERHQMQHRQQQAGKRQARRRREKREEEGRELRGGCCYSKRVPNRRRVGKNKQYKVRNKSD